MNNNTVYLAGPITEDPACVNWRERVRNSLKFYGIECLLPTRDEFFVNKGSAPMDAVKWITTRDKNDVRSSAAILINFAGTKKVSIGTCIEIGWASMLDIPIIAILDNLENLHNHGMIKELCIIVTDEKSAINKVLTLLNKNG